MEAEGDGLWRKALEATPFPYMVYFPVRVFLEKVSPAEALRLIGLDPTAHYEIRLLNPEDAPPQSRARCALATGSLRLSGAALMAQGILLPVAWPATIWMIEGSVAQVV